MRFLPVNRLSVILPLLIVLAVTGPACSKNEKAETKEAVSMDLILSERAARDAFFRRDANSPIPDGDREDFKGLVYYPVDPDLRFSVRLNRHSAPKRVRLATNTGEIRSGLRYGYFDFVIDGQACRLQVYRLDDVAGNSGPSLFIPFRDATSGKETYGAGRYIDLEENTSGVYDLDFNRAYNPYCVFSSDYSCPLPPDENTLTVPVRAGEKMYGGKSKAD